MSSYVVPGAALSTDSIKIVDGVIVEANETFNKAKTIEALTSLNNLLDNQLESATHLIDNETFVQIRNCTKTLLSLL